MVTIGELWSRWRSYLLPLLASAAFTVCIYAAKAWANETYVQIQKLSQATLSRDLKDINSELEDIELEIQRTQIWLRFLPQEEATMRQIYGAELDVLEQTKAKIDRRREEALQALENQ
jgi:hypothetical protein